MPQKRKRASYLFTLKLNIEDILLYYYGAGKDKEMDDEIGETPVMDFCDEEPTISKLMHDSSDKFTYFLDIYKNTVKYWMNMYDIVKNGPLPQYTTLPCWHCKYEFNTHPIGCPLKYVSECEEGPIKEKIKQYQKDANLPTEYGIDYFETEGIFCSGPCIKAYIMDMLAKTKSPTYQRALTLLTLMFQKLFGRLITIPVAPSWKLLIGWGGHLSIEEYRHTFGRLEYRETNNLQRPYMYPRSTCIQEIRAKRTNYDAISHNQM